jgi:hypothetical protein
MKRQRIFFFFFFILLAGKSYPQGFRLSQPRLKIDDNQLLIYYDIIGNRATDKLYLRVEISKADGKIIPAKALSGDLGEFISVGNNKTIIWNAEKDSVYLNEPVFVELKAEKYERPFHKSSMMMLSAIFPGWGQSKISKGKLWWLAGVATYGTLAGGYFFHQSYIKSYNSYINEEVDPVKRAALASQSQRQLIVSNVLLYSSASVWAVNVLWVGFTPDKYKPLQYVKLSLNPSYSPNTGNSVFLSLKLDF